MSICHHILTPVYLLAEKQVPEIPIFQIMPGCVLAMSHNPQPSAGKSLTRYTPVALSYLPPKPTPVCLGSLGLRPAVLQSCHVEALRPAPRSAERQQG